MVALFVAAVILALVAMDVSYRFVAARRAAARSIVNVEQPKTLETVELPYPSLALSLQPPDGLLFSSSHLWLRLIPSGELTIGLDELASGLLGDIQRILLPETGKTIKRGAVCCVVETPQRIIHFLVPLEVVVTHVNSDINHRLNGLRRDPYGEWLLAVKPVNVLDNVLSLASLKGDAEAKPWLGAELERARRVAMSRTGADGGVPLPGGRAPRDLAAPKSAWREFEHEFLGIEEGN